MPNIRLTVALLALTWGITACGPSSTPPPSPAVAPVTNAPSASSPATAGAEFAKLKGRWLRPDGGYVIEIKELLPDGKLSAAYFNPRSINVSQAEIRKDAGAVKIFLELRDQNYPGATYNLTYDPEHDLLAGAYFQPLAGETYQVQFERMKDEGNSR